MTLIWLALLSAPAYAEPMAGQPAAPVWNISCDYVFMGYPTSSVALEILPDGHIGEAARITMQGSTHLESFTDVEKAAEEAVHGWLSKENPQNEIELVIYREPQRNGQSKIVNHKIPFGKEIWGNCKKL